MNTKKNLIIVLAANVILGSLGAATLVYEGAGASNASGTYWGGSSNWSGSTPGDIPDSSADTAEFNNDFVNFDKQTVFLATSSGVDNSYTIGNLEWRATTNNSQRDKTVANLVGGTGSLTFDAGGGSSTFDGFVATIPVFTMDVAISLSNDLSFDVGSTGSPTGENIFFNKTITGTGGLQFASSMVHGVLLNASNTFTGSTLIEGGRLTVASGGTLGQSLTSMTGGTLTLQGSNTVYDSQGLDLSTGSSVVLNFAGTETISSLVLDNVAQGAGVYDSSTNPGFFSGTGSLQVIPEPAAFSIFLALIAILPFFSRNYSRHDRD